MACILLNRTARQQVWVRCRVKSGCTCGTCSKPVALFCLPRVLTVLCYPGSRGAGAPVARLPNTPGHGGS